MSGPAHTRNLSSFENKSSVGTATRAAHSFFDVQAADGGARRFQFWIGVTKDLAASSFLKSSDEDQTVSVESLTAAFSARYLGRFSCAALQLYTVHVAPSLSLRISGAREKPEVRRISTVHLISPMDREDVVSKRRRSAKEVSLIMVRKREGGAEIVGRNCLSLDQLPSINLAKFAKYTILFLTPTRLRRLQIMATCPCHLHFFFCKQPKARRRPFQNSLRPRQQSRSAKCANLFTSDDFYQRFDSRILCRKLGTISIESLTAAFL